MLILIDDDPISINLIEKQISISYPDISVISYIDPRLALKDLLDNLDNWECIVITDLNMPYIDGISLVSELSNYNHKYKIFVTSTFFLEDHISKCKDLGVKCFEKTFDWDLIMEQIF